jgi:inner membrane protein
MPSPIGHALAGTAVVWAADSLDRRRSPIGLTATCAALAALPDLDLLVPRFHRSATHSVAAVLLVLIIAAAMTGKVTRLRAGRYGGQARWRVGLICAAAYASHLVLDWLGADQYPPGGIQLLWPFGHHFFKSGWDLFDQTERQRLFANDVMIQNIRAVGKEIAMLAPITVALWLIRVKALARFPSELARRDHPTQ